MSDKENISSKKQQVFVITLATAGQVVEFYDFLLFVFFAKSMSVAFFNGGHTGYLYLLCIFAAGYIARPFGGVIFGHFGDKFGRVNTFFTTIMLISLSTLFIGLLPSGKTFGILSPILLLCLRLLQGFSLGGEMPGAATFIYESMPANMRIFGTSFIFAGLNLGTVLASIAFAVTSYIYAKNPTFEYFFAWRIPFIIGGIAGIIIGVLRRFLMETPVFDQLLQIERTTKYPFIELLTKHWKNLVKGIVIYLITLPGTIILITLPHGIRLNNTYINIINTSFLILHIILIIFFSIIIQKKYFNIYKFYLLGCILLGLTTYPIFKLIFINNHISIIIAYFLYISLAAIFVSVIIPIIISLFPAHIRYTGTAASINIGAILSTGIVPLVTNFSKRNNSDYILISVIMFVCILCAVYGLYLVLWPPIQKKLNSFEVLLEKINDKLNKLNPIYFSKPFPCYNIQTNSFQYSRDLNKEFNSLKNQTEKLKTLRGKNEETECLQHGFNLKSFDRYLDKFFDADINDDNLKWLRLYNKTTIEKLVKDMNSTYQQKFNNPETREREKLILRKFLEKDFDSLMNGIPFTDKQKYEIVNKIDNNNHESHEKHEKK